MKITCSIYLKDPKDPDVKRNLLLDSIEYAQQDDGDFLVENFVVTHETFKLVIGSCYSKSNDGLSFGVILNDVHESTFLCPWPTAMEPYLGLNFEGLGYVEFFFKKTDID